MLTAIRHANSEPTWHLTVPKSSKQTQNQIKTLPTIQPNRLIEPKSLDFTTWVSDNLYRLVAICVLIITIAAVFFLYTSTDTASLLCLQSQTQRAVDSISVPRIEWNSIKSNSDKSSPYANFISEQWVVVSVSDYPSQALRKTVKIKGWQVLAIENSRTPKDWSLKGSIFLSLDMQASLGFRVVEHLPYDSYVRKSVGYLFAIQHGDIHRFANLWE